MSKYLKNKRPFDGVKVVSIYVLIIAVAVMITAIGQRVKYKNQIKEINANHAEEIAALREELQDSYESKIAELEQYYEYGGDVIQIEREAECIAKVFYGYGAAINHNHSVSDLRGIAWCIFNRVEHYAYPDTVAEVCEQPKQWMGYSSDNPVLTEYYDLALEELKIWYSGGHRPMNNSYIYLTWSSKEILLRDTFEENRNTNYWRMR